MPDEDYSNLSALYGEVVGQFRRYIGHVGYNFGGVYENLKKNNQYGYNCSRLLKFIRE